MMFYFWSIYYPVVELLARILSRDLRRRIEPQRIHQLLSLLLRYITKRKSPREWDRIAWAYAVRYFRDESEKLGLRVPSWRDTRSVFQETRKVKLKSRELIHG